MLLMAAFGVVSAAGSEGRLVIADFEQGAVPLGTALSREHVHSGEFALKWPHTTSGFTLQVPRDWSAYNAFSCWLFNARKSSDAFMLIISSENNATSGSDYYFKRITLDWTGWKHFEGRFKALGRARSPLGFDQVGGVTFTASGWGNQPNPKNCVWVDELSLENLPPEYGPRTSLKDFFEALDLERPDLAEVKAAVEKGDLEAATHLFLQHLRERNYPNWEFDWRCRPKRRLPSLPTGNSEGWDYFSWQFTLDWTGWKHFVLPLADFATSRKPHGWDFILSLSANASGWGAEPDPESSLCFDAVKLVGKGGEYVVDDFEGPCKTEGVERVSAPMHSGEHAGLWADHPFQRTVTFWGAPLDWTPYEALEFWAYSPAATGAKITLVATSDNPGVIGDAERIVNHEFRSVGVWHKFGGPIDWTLDPINYREWTWQLNRHPMWSTLASAYWLTGDERYAQEFAFEVQDWCMHCPPPEEGECGYSSDCWRPIEAGIRMGQVWFPALYRFLGSPSVSDETWMLMLRSMVDHARFLMRCFTPHGNWNTMESNGLFHVGAMLPELKEADEWRKTATERLFDQLEAQVYPDGAQKELTTGYHQVAILNMTAPYLLARRLNLPLPDGYLERLERLYAYNMWVQEPDHRTPALNDGSRAWVPGSLANGAKLFPHRKDFLYFATLGRKGTPPKELSHFFPWAGQAVMRTGWGEDANYLLIEVGPFGIGHQHEDKLGLVVYADGHEFLPDAGNYPYDSSEWRKYVLSTRSHNTIRVDGCDQNRRRLRDTYEAKQPLRDCWTSTPEVDFVTGSYTSGYGPEGEIHVEHTRTVCFLKPDLWFVADFLQPETPDEAHSYQTLFHFDAEKLEQDAAGKVTALWEGKSFQLVPVLLPEGAEVKVVSGQKEPEVQGWLPSGGYSVKPIPTLEYLCSGKGEKIACYALCAAKDDLRRIRQFERLPAAPGVCAVSITRGDGSKVLFVARASSSDAPLAAGGYSFNTRAFVVEQTPSGASKHWLFEVGQAD